MSYSSKKKIRTSLKAWSTLVRMALHWGRHIRVFKRCPLLELRNLFSKHLKTLAHHHSNDDRYLFRYGERQLSFDETPLFNVEKKTHRPAFMRFLLPCIAPPVDFDYGFEIDGRYCSDEVVSYGFDDESYMEEFDRTAKDDEEEDKWVDVRAEEFIAKFYEQIKLQKQISYLGYKES